VAAVAEVLDEALIEAVRAGDTAAFETLYRRHLPAVRKVLFAKLGRADLVDDAIQDVFLKALQSLGTLRDPDRLAPWLKAIARNVATDRFTGRRDEAIDDLGADEPASTAPGLDEIGEVRELARLVQGAITQLSARDTEAVMLAGYLDASPAEIAEHLGVSVGAAKVVLHRARRRLRLALKLELLVRRRAGACVEFRSLADDEELVRAAKHLADCAECQRAGSVEIRLYGSDGSSGGARSVLVRSPRGERRIDLGTRLVIGRDCDDIPPAERLEIDEASVSREHAELRVSSDGSTYLLDASTNGTRLNGVRVERSVRTTLADGDVVGVGDTELVLTLPTADRAEQERRSAVATARHALPGPAAMVVGDIVGFTTIAENSGSAELGIVLDRLFSELKALLRLAGGSLGNIVGDAIFGVWEERFDESAPERALGFARTAHRFVQRFTPPVALPTPDGRLRMGWAVGGGEVAMPGLVGHGVTVVGDAANVVFRLASLADRDGMAPVLATDELAARVDDAGLRSAVRHKLEVKGRSEPVTVVEVPA
jgi:RNA polymerase sigma factor (sigma-70 family)